MVDIKVHPDWKFNSETFDADIAVATLQYPVSFTRSVQPVCLPNYNSVFIHPLGTVVGWGKSETSGPENGDHESVPKQIEVRAVTNEECFLSYVEFAKISSHRTFCAGWPGQNIGPCHGNNFKINLQCSELIPQHIEQVILEAGFIIVLATLGTSKESSRQPLLTRDVATSANIRFTQTS